MIIAGIVIFFFGLGVAQWRAWEEMRQERDALVRELDHLRKERDYLINHRIGAERMIVEGPMAEWGAVFYDGNDHSWSSATFTGTTDGDE